ncbi:ankyrin repeat-containing domain protein [Ilyonectria destructans]|nr:ankyrin repeat-containing domain protein [Ilyonectria destructans]
MDPLSLAASVAGLVSLADLVFRTATKYWKEVKDSRKDVDELLSEVKGVSILLHDLSLVAFSLEIDPSQNGGRSEHSSHLKLHHLYECQKLLRQLEQSLNDAKKKFNSPSSLNRLQSRLKWPFSSREMSQIVQSIQRHKQAINVALTADSVAQLKVSLSLQEDTSTRVKDLQTTTKRILEIQTRIVLDEKKRRILNFFTKCNPQSEFEMSKSLRHPLTGLWLTEGVDFQEWFSTQKSRIWLTGIPGAGKSVLAGAIITECLTRTQATPGVAVAYFFCTYRDKSTHKSSNILSSVATQLARQDETAYQVLKQAYDDLESSHFLSREPTDDMLMETLDKMCTLFNQVYLVIDGLDECGVQVENTIRKLLSLVNHNDSQIINTAFLSRDELPIREKLEPTFDCVEIEAHTEDLQLYVAAELEERINSKRLRLRDMTLKDRIMTQLVSGAKGMFRWVACQLDHLCELPSDKARRRALERLPPTLPATCERILLRVEACAEEVRVLVQRCLLLLASGEALTTREICEAVSISHDCDTLDDDDILDENEILRWCGSLVRKSSNGYEIEFAHFTVKEFLQDSCPKDHTLSFYAVSHEKIYQFLGSICLYYMTLEDYDHLPEATENEIRNILTREKSRPFYRRAASSWPRYVHQQSNECQGGTLQYLFDLFQTHKTKKFCLWAIEFIRDYVFCDIGGFGSNPKMAIWVISSVLRPDFTPLHMAAALSLPDLCTHLLERGAKVNLRGEFGTPLHCATAPNFMFSNGELDDYQYDWDSNARRRRTVQVLLSAGANVNLQLPARFLSLTTLSISVLLSVGGADPEVIADLISAEIDVEEKDIELFEFYYADLRSDFSVKDFKDSFNGGQAFTHLLRVLGDHEGMNTSRSRLYAMTLDFSKHMELDPKLFDFPSNDATDDEVHAFLDTVISSNDVLKLEQFVQDGGSESLKRLKFDSMWTPIHLATIFGSLDVLAALMEVGCDPNDVDNDGQTPVQLCGSNRDEDVLRVLLKHGGSTVLPDKNNKTIWHTASEMNSCRIIKVLVEQDERDQGLQMESDKHGTPICTAIACGQEEAALILLPHCNTKEFWKSKKPIYRQAAKLGSKTVLKKILDIGIDLDGFDEKMGNPLHFLATDSSFEFVSLLKEVFSIDQRRRDDSRTPFELTMLAAIETGAVPSPNVLTALLPEALTSTYASTIWKFLCCDAISSTLYADTVPTWLSHLFSTLIEQGIIDLWEEGTNTTAIAPFASNLVEHGFQGGSLVEALQQRDGFTRDDLSTQEDATALDRLDSWELISVILMQIAKKSKLKEEALHEPNMNRLLSLSIIHDDGEMIKLLVRNGVDVHAKIDYVSPSELACFACIDLSDENFDFLATNSRADLIIRGNKALGGRGPLHFTAGSLDVKGSVSKLDRLLQVNADCNLPIDYTWGSPLVYHIGRQSVDTARMLLDAGANPWLAASSRVNAPLMAIYRDYPCLLETIVKRPQEEDSSRHWSQKWTVPVGGLLLSGGNALHRAAMNRQPDCLEILLNADLLPRLQVPDNIQQTPMHYAAIFGNSSAIAVLHDNGQDIDATSQSGHTPLHLAALNRHLDCVETLLKLGAKQIADAGGFIPLVFAYMTGNQGIIGALKTEADFYTSSSTTDPAGVQHMGQALQVAIQGHDLEACKTLHALGCPLDIGLDDTDGNRISPLMMALCYTRSTELVAWLLQNGVTVSTVYSHPIKGGFFTALNAAISDAAFNSILPALVEQYLLEGGDFLHLPCTPLHTAILNKNLEGLQLFLSTFRNHHREDKSRSHSDSRDSIEEVPATITTALVNQRDTNSFYHPSALLIAVDRRDIHVVNVLIENLADMDQADLCNRTALHVAASAGSVEMTKSLLFAGASSNITDVFGCTPLMRACARGHWEVIHVLINNGASITTRDNIGRNSLSYIAINKGNLANLQVFDLLLDSGVDIHQVDTFGWSATNYLLSDESQIYLRSLLVRDFNLLQPMRVQWPESCWIIASHSPPTRLIAITKNLRLLGRYLNTEELMHLADLQTPWKHNLLCQAACRGLVEAIQNFLAIGADIEQRCHDHGTPLEAAMLNGRLEAIKVLVRAGAEIPSKVGGLLGRLPKQKILVPQTCEWILHWLSVARYLEQLKLAYENFNRETADIKTWSGVRTGEVGLKWQWQKGRQECLLDYAKRRRGIAWGLRGKVVEVIGLR